MGAETAIAWTDHTFNPWIGCQRWSEGCRHCYAEELVTRRMKRDDLWGPISTASRQRTARDYWLRVRRWNAVAETAGVPGMVFCGSLCDVFEAAPQLDAWRQDLWSLIRGTPWLDWQLLTKRPENISSCLPDDWGNGYRNVWLGTSIEDARVAQRASVLAAVPAIVHFISYEPAIGPLAGAVNLDHIEWLIYGGESGPGHRPEGLPDDPKAWARDIRSECDRLGIAFFHKQSAAPRTEMGIELDGEILRAFPQAHARERQGTLLW